MKSLVLTPVTFFKISWENALEVRPIFKKSVKNIYFYVTLY